MDEKKPHLNKHEVYDDRYWQDGLAGMYNIVKYNGEDVRAVAFVEDVQMRNAIVNEHNRVVREMAEKAALLDWLIHHPSKLTEDLIDDLKYGGERALRALRCEVVKHGQQWLGQPNIRGVLQDG